MTQIDARDELEDWLGWAQENAEAAVLRGCPPDSAEAAQVVHRILEPVPGEHPLDGEELQAVLEVVTDPRILNRCCACRLFGGRERRFRLGPAAQPQYPQA